MPGSSREEAARRLATLPHDEPTRRRLGWADEVHRGRATPAPGLRRIDDPRGQDPGAAQEVSGRGRVADRAVLRRLGQARQGGGVADEARRLTRRPEGPAQALKPTRTLAIRPPKSDSIRRRGTVSRRAG